MEVDRQLLDDLQFFESSRCLGAPGYVDEPTFLRLPAEIQLAPVARYPGIRIVCLRANFIDGLRLGELLLLFQVYGADDVETADFANALIRVADDEPAG